MLLHFDSSPSRCLVRAMHQALPKKPKDDSLCFSSRFACVPLLFNLLRQNASRKVQLVWCCCSILTAPLSFPIYSTERENCEGPVGQKCIYVCRRNLSKAEQQNQTSGRALFCSSSSKSEVIQANRARDLCRVIRVVSELSGLTQSHSLSATHLFREGSDALTLYKCRRDQEGL